MSARRFWWCLAAIAAAGLAWRIVYVLVWRADAGIGGDTEFYHEAAKLLADGKGFLNPFFSEPGAPYQSADHPPLYWAYLAFFSKLGLRTPLEHMLVSTLLGAGTVVGAGVAGRAIASARAGLAAAVLAAFYANVWSWDGMILSEAMAVLTVTLTMWAAYRYRRAPTVVNALLLGAMAALATLSRAELVLLLLLVVVPLVWWSGAPPVRARLRRLVAAGAAALVLLGPWVGYNMTRFEHPVYLSVGFEITLASASCDHTYYGNLIGYWHFDCAKPIRDALPPGLDQSEEVSYFREAATDYIRDNLDQVPLVIAARWGRITHLFRPWQQSQLDTIPEGREPWIARTGLFTFYALMPLALAGALALRGRRAPVYPLLAPLLTVWITITIAFAQVRYRAAAEPAIVLLAAVALGALWDRARPRGSAAGAVSERAGVPAGRCAGAQAAGQRAGQHAAHVTAS
jgi:4-amino-4-deoxy-L-arabinose transferase-like glycosyltransferase